MDERDLLRVSSPQEWRDWLAANHDRAVEAWLVLYKKGKREGSLTLSEAVEQALCFGWIDGKLRSLDAESYALRFTPRKANSVWSVSNIRRADSLTQQGLMTEAGLEKVGEGRQSGQWEAAIRRERTDEIPPDLAKALRRRKGAIKAYRDLPDSRKKMLLHWLFTAKKPETRQRRVKAIVEEVSG